MIARSTLFAAALATAVCLAPSASRAQDSRLLQRLPPDARVEVEALLDSARQADIPAEPLVDRALEGASKGASGDRIVAAVRRYASELETARRALGSEAAPPELVAGASALRAGADEEALARLRRVRRGRPVTVAAAVVADLVAVGVPADSAISTVLALAERVDDKSFLALRRNVERDIELGASPVAALNIRSELIQGASGADQAQNSPGPRKP